MSHTIEKGKRVLVFKGKPGDERFPSYYDGTTLFLVAASSNNVSPRHYDWQVIASGHLSNWGGEFQMPASIWEMGYSADGGMIKPYGKDVSGLDYLKSWKRAGEKAQPADGWRPKVSIWVGSYGDGAAALAAALNEQGPAVFGKYDAETRQALYDAFKRLFPDPVEGGNSRTYVKDDEQLADAIYLYRNREQLPFSLYLVDDEGSAFFKRPAKVFAEAGA